MATVTLLGVSAQADRVIVLKAIRTASSRNGGDASLNAAKGHLAMAMAGEPVRFYLADDTDADWFLSELTRGGAQAART